MYSQPVMVDWLKLLCICTVPLVTVKAGLANPANIQLALKGKAVFDGALQGGEVVSTTESEPAQSVFLGYPHGPKTSEFVPKGAERLTYLVKADGAMTGTIHASKDSTPCDARQ